VVRDRCIEDQRPEVALWNEESSIADAAADAALGHARSLPRGNDRSEAFKEASRLIAFSGNSAEAEMRSKALIIMIGWTIPDIKQLLLDLLGEDALPVLYPEHLVGHGQKTCEHAAKLNWEGIISKRADALYRSERTRPG
jgi:hypothetical protein